jgi:hypothetical protein
MSANKTPAIRDKAIHRLADHEVGVSAAINAIVLGPTGYVMHVWYIHCQEKGSQKNYTSN